MIFRKAKISDVEQMASLINYYAEQGLMLHRTLPILISENKDYTLIVKIIRS